MSRFWTHITAAAIAAITLVAGRAAVASAETPAPPGQPATQTISAARPQGQIVLSDLSVTPRGRLELTVTDTRDDDPGWSVSVTVASDDTNSRLGWKPAVERQTPAFTTSDGTTYTQLVEAGPSVSPSRSHGVGIDEAVLGSAPRGHGLGVAVLSAKLTAAGPLGDRAPTITVTVV